jgi:ubiquinone/menaquinone biosynthesis C-methylase UbiE
MDIHSESFLQEFHKKYPSCSSNGFIHGFTEKGLHSYALLVDFLQDTRGALLDVACGDGFLLEMFFQQRQSAQELFGIDMSVGELEVAWQNEHLPKTHVLRGNARELPFADRTFESVTCHMAFMLMPKVDEIAAEIHRVLQPGGHFVAVVPAERIQDEAVQIYRDWLTRNVSNEKLQSLRGLGDSRVATREGLKEIFAGFSHFSLEKFEMHYHLTPEAMTENFSTLYASGFLSPREHQRMKEELVQAYRSLGRERIHHMFPIYRLVAKK